MASEFNPSGHYYRSRYVIVFENAQGKDEEFYSLLQPEFEKINLPNTRMGVGEFSAKSSLFGSKSAVKMLCIKSDEEKNIEIWFRATVVGNMLVLRKFEIGIFYPKEAQINSVDYITALDWIGDYLFYKVIAKMDPNYKESLSLFEMKKSKAT